MKERYSYYNKTLEIQITNQNNQKFDLKVCKLFETPELKITNSIISNVKIDNPDVNLNAFNEYISNYYND